MAVKATTGDVDMQQRVAISSDSQDESSENFGSFFWGVGAFFATAFAVLWMFFGDACDGSIVCGVVPVYFAVFTMFVLAATEIAVTAFGLYLRVTNPTPTL